MKKSEDESSSSGESLDPYDEAIIDALVNSDEETSKKIRSSTDSNGSIRRSPCYSESPEADFYKPFNYERRFVSDNPKAEVASIVKEIRQKELPFPLIRYNYSKEQVLESFQRLKEYKPNWVARSHHELKGHTGEWWLPTVFRGKPLQFVTKKNDWWKLDMAVDYFTEYERVRARKEYDRSMEDDWYDDAQLEKAVTSCASKGVVNAQNLRESMFYIGR